MKIVNSKIKEELKIRTQKDYPIKGIEFIDIMPLVLQGEIYQQIIQIFVEEIVKKGKVDYIVAPEARGFLFGCPVAQVLKIGCIPVRKEGKLPPNTIEAEVEYEKEYGTDKLILPKLVEGNYKGKQFYIVDDIYATGNTINAMKHEIEQLGGIVVGCGVVMNIIELNQANDIFSILEVNEE